MARGPCAGRLAVLVGLAACLFSMAHARQPDTSAGDAAAGSGGAGRSLLGFDSSLLSRVRLPAGFKITAYYGEEWTPARFFAVGNKGKAAPVVVFVSSLGNEVWALVDRTGNGTAVTRCTLLSGLDNPNGITYDPATGSLYVAEVRRLMRYDNVDAAALQGCRASLLRKHKVVGGDVLPVQASHSNRFLGLGPDGKLYVTIAAPFNVDVCKDPYCAIWRMDKNGSNPEVFARGIRNAAAWDWHPTTKDLVFAGMGDNKPDDLMHSLERPGLDLKWPYCHWEGSGPPGRRSPGPGTPLADPDMTLPALVAGGKPRPADAVIERRCAAIAKKPLQTLGPHVAPLGVLYWPPAAGLKTGQQRWPARFGNGFFSAQHGSWNRATPIGYRIMHVQLAADNRTAARYTQFASGWLQGTSSVWGRPVGLARLPDGSMLVGDDQGGVVYRISYEPDT